MYAPMEQWHSDPRYSDLLKAIGATSVDFSQQLYQHDFVNYLALWTACSVDVQQLSFPGDLGQGEIEDQEQQYQPKFADFPILGGSRNPSASNSLK